MTMHRSATPEQLTLPFPVDPDAKRPGRERDEIVLLLAQLLLSAARRRPAEEARDESR
jgi:hypothetical protein